MREKKKIKGARQLPKNKNKRFDAKGRKSFFRRGGGAALRKQESCLLNDFFGTLGG
jgi:hypothetical protein